MSYEVALWKLYSASLCESISGPSINNAYYGDLSESNEYRINDIEILRCELIKLVPALNGKETQLAAMERAKADKQKFQKLCENEVDIQYSPLALT